MPPKNARPLCWQAGKGPAASPQVNFTEAMRLAWDKPGHLTLPLRDSDTAVARTDVPFTTTGQPPVIAFGPANFAGALATGSALRLKLPCSNHRSARSS